MRAAVYNKYGGPEVVKVSNVEKPEPRANEILVKVKATTVTSADSRARSLTLPPGFGPLGRPMFGFTAPRKKILGVEFSGIVEQVGSEVTNFKVGDEIVGMDGMKMAAHAEFKTVKADGCVVLKPSGISFEDAAAIPFGATTAMSYLTDKTQVQKGDSVMVLGASGSVGSAAVQVANSLGAEVTGVCSSKNIDLVKSLGASDVIDYKSEQITKNGKLYDYVLDTTGKYSFQELKQVTKPKGKILLIVGGLGDILKSISRSPKTVVGPASEKSEYLNYVMELVEQGKYKPIIGETFALTEIQEAHKYVDTGHKVGSAVVKI